MTEIDYMNIILTLYTDLLSSFEGDKSALKKIDTVFEKPLEKINENKHNNKQA